MVQEWGGSLVLPGAQASTPPPPTTPLYSWPPGSEEQPQPCVGAFQGHPEQSVQRPRDTASEGGAAWGAGGGGDGDSRWGSQRGRRAEGAWAPQCLVWDYDSRGKHDFIGEFSTTYEEMQKAFGEDQVSWGPSPPSPENRVETG